MGEVNMNLMDDVETLAERVMGASLQIKGWKMPPKPDYSDDEQQEDDEEDKKTEDVKPVGETDDGSDKIMKESEEGNKENDEKSDEQEVKDVPGESTGIGAKTDEKK